MKYREFWIEMTEHLAVVHDGENQVQVGPSYYAIPSHRSWILVSNKSIDNSVHVIDIDAYNNVIKMLEEMANYVDCLKEGYYLKCNCGACKTLDKYRKFKEGLK